MRGGRPSNDSRKGQSVWRKGKYGIIDLDIVGSTPVSPKNADSDAETGNGGWHGRSAVY